jgi:hypothetical protein
MAFPLIPFAVGIAVGALAASALRGTRAGAAIGRQARRVVDEVGDRVSDAISRKGGLVREHYPQPPTGTARGEEGAAGGVRPSADGSGDGPREAGPDPAG